MQISEELAREAHDVMAQAFVVMRDRARSAKAHDRGLSRPETQGLFSLSDALHNIPTWLHPDPDRRMPCTEEEMRREVDRAKTVLGLN